MGFWGAILGTAAVFGVMQQNIFFLCLLPVTLVLIILHSYWLNNVFDANEKDKSTAFGANDAAYKLAKLKYEKPENKKNPYYKDWSDQFQFAMTAILSVWAFIFVVLSVLN